MIDSLIHPQEFIEAWPLFRAATLAGVYSGVLLGLLGVYVVLRRMVFLSATLSQVASLGVSSSFALAAFFPFLASHSGHQAFASFCVFVALVGIVRLRSANESGADVLLGILFLLGWGGTLAISSHTGGELHDIDSLLYGSAVAVVPDDLTRLARTGSVVVAMQIWWWRGFFIASFDRRHARTRGVPVTLLDFALLISVAIAIALVTEILGALPAFAFTVLPAVGAIALARGAAPTLLLSAALGGATGLFGYYTAWALDLPVGASYALVGTVLVAICWSLRLLIRLLARLRSALSGDAE